MVLVLSLNFLWKNYFEHLRPTHYGFHESGQLSCFKQVLTKTLLFPSACISAW